MRPEDIRAHLHTLPFQPIRIYISDGSSYEVRHPDFLLVARRQVIIAQGNGAGQLPDRLVYRDPVHITRIEPIKKAPRKSKTKRRR